MIPSSGTVTSPYSFVAYSTSSLSLVGMASDYESDPISVSIECITYDSMMLVELCQK